MRGIQIGSTATFDRPLPEALVRAATELHAIEIWPGGQIWWFPGAKPDTFLRACKDFGLWIEWRRASREESATALVQIATREIADEIGKIQIGAVKVNAYTRHQLWVRKRACERVILRAARLDAVLKAASISLTETAQKCGAEIVGAAFQLTSTE